MPSFMKKGLNSAKGLKKGADMAYKMAESAGVVDMAKA
jgi:hypothetical protein